MGSAAVADGELTGADLAPGAVGGAQLGADGIDGPKIGDGRLRLPDVASFTGTFTLGPAAAGRRRLCRDRPARGPDRARRGAGPSRRRDRAHPARRLAVRAHRYGTGDGRPAQLAVSVCALAAVDGPPSTFRYASFDG